MNVVGKYVSFDNLAYKDSKFDSSLLDILRIFNYSLDPRGKVEKMFKTSCMVIKKCELVGK